MLILPAADLCQTRTHHPQPKPFKAAKQLCAPSVLSHFRAQDTFFLADAKVKNYSFIRNSRCISRATLAPGVSSVTLWMALMIKAV
jgi:hypothetical protein